LETKVKSSTSLHQNVILANGCVSFIEDVSATSSLSLSSAFYALKIPFSLLYVSRITHSLNCLVLFFLAHCVFEELGTRRMICTWFEHVIVSFAFGLHILLIFIVV